MPWLPAIDRRARGRSRRAAIDEDQWSEEFSGELCGFPTLLVDRNKGRPVRKLELRADDGRLLGDGDTELKPNPRVKRRQRLSA